MEYLIINIIQRIEVTEKKGYRVNERNFIELDPDKHSKILNENKSKGCI